MYKIFPPEKYTRIVLHRGAVGSTTGLPLQSSFAEGLEKGGKLQEPEALQSTSISTAHSSFYVFKQQS